MLISSPRSRREVHGTKLAHKTPNKLLWDMLLTCKTENPATNNESKKNTTNDHLIVTCAEPLLRLSSRSDGERRLGKLTSAEPQICWACFVQSSHPMNQAGTVSMSTEQKHVPSSTCLSLMLVHQTSQQRLSLHLRNHGAATVDIQDSSMTTICLFRSLSW